MINLRRISQILFLLLFVILLLLTTARALGAYYSEPNFLLNIIPANLFFIADPLVALSVMLVSRAFIMPFLAAVIVAIATILLGRVFCGWVCPLGTVMDLFSRVKPKHSNQVLRDGGKMLKKVKYLVLMFILAAAIVGANIVGWFDPITIAFRAFALVFYPIFDYLAKGILDGVGATGAVGTLGNFGLVDPNSITFYGSAVFLGVFALIIFAVFYQSRFWCRYICPLGALLGILSKCRVLKLNIGPGCNQCGRCNIVCKTGCLSKELVLESEECIQCYTCVSKCQHHSLAINFGSNTLPKDNILPSRRGFILTAGLGILSVPILRHSIMSKRNYNTMPRLRPPGATSPEEEFLNKCIRCGECMKVCPTNGLQPLLVESGLYSMWTPTLVPRIGQCSYYCNACGQVCPTGAIKALQLEDKQESRIGLAYFDTNRCIPYVHKQTCMTCEEFCPVPDKAIAYNERNGIKYPYIVKDRCIGCGMCEKVCPVAGMAAIRVFPFKSNGNS
ncbi:MAG: 4Fe-4S binding protein [Candidatus Brocadiia bacterium]